MSKHYRAIRSCYGFRGKFWERGEVALDVTELEAKTIPEHFAPIPKGEKAENPDDLSFAPRETDTLSEMQERDEQELRKTERK